MDLPLVVCSSNQLDWAMDLGIPLLACPHAEYKRIPWAEDPGPARVKPKFVMEPTAAIIDSAWEIRPQAIIHIGAMTLQETELDIDLCARLLSSVAVSSLISKTLDIPFVYLTPGGPVEVPGTEKGAQGLLGEDLVDDDQWIVRVNGAFGPLINNQIKRIVGSTIPNVDDVRQVNPTWQGTVNQMLTHIAHMKVPPNRVNDGPSVLELGGPQTTWYNFFKEAGLTGVRSWEDEFSKKFTRELMWEWGPPPTAGSYSSSAPYLAEWFDAAN